MRTPVLLSLWIYFHSCKTISCAWVAVREEPGKKGSIISISFLLCLLNVADSQGNNLPGNLQSVNQTGVLAPWEVCGATLQRYSPFAEIVARRGSEISQHTTNRGETSWAEGFALLGLVWSSQNKSSPDIIKKLQFMGTNRINALCCLWRAHSNRKGLIARVLKPQN